MYNICTWVEFYFYVRGHSYIDFHGKVRHITFWVYRPYKMKACLVQSSYLTMSWPQLQSVGTACSIHILRSNAMMKSHGLTHIDH